MSNDSNVTTKAEQNKNAPITPKELASHFKTTVPTVLDWYHKGHIPCVIAIGRIIRFDLDAVTEALAKKPKKGGAKR